MNREIISFEVSGQLFGIDIMAIKEIRAWSAVTRMPGVPAHVAGVVNLRGAILPVIDLSTRLGWGPTDANERNAIIVIDVKGRSCGLVVEAVSDLVSIPTAQIQPPPAIGGDIASAFVEGLAPVGERMVLILNLEAVAGLDVAA